MGYKYRPTLRIDLGELGDNNGVPFFVEIKHPKLLTYSERMKFALAAKDIKDGEGNITMTEDTVNKMRDVSKEYIMAWNLLSLEDEQPISPNDENALQKVPGEVIEAIQKTIGEFTKQKDDETKNSLEQSDKS